jgi:hypothetical protein
MEKGDALAIGYPLSQKARTYVEQSEYVRQRERTCADQELVALLEKHGLPVTEALLDFERNLGGWNHPGKLSTSGMGIYLSLQEGEGVSNIAKLFRKKTWIFGPAEPDEDGIVAPIHGTGYPRAFFEDRVLVPVGMWGEDVLLFIGTGGEIYVFVTPLNEVHLKGASGRTYLEQRALMDPRWFRGQTWYEVHLCADVGELAASLLGVPRFEPACDRLFDTWANERAQVHLVHDVAPNVFGTQISVKDAEELVNVVRRLREVHPEVRVLGYSVNGMQSNYGYQLLEEAGVL